MKRIAFVVAGLLCGCCCTGPRTATQSGWRFEYIQPPIMEVSTPALVQQSPGLLGAAPWGAASGPVLNGAFQQGPLMATSVPVMPTPLPMPAPVRMAAPALPPPLPEVRERAALPTAEDCTLEEMCRRVKELEKRLGR